MLNQVKNSMMMLKLNEKIHRTTYKHHSRLMQKSLERFERCNSKKTKSQIRNEIQLCKKFWGCYPLHYFRYNLYKNDTQISNEDLLNYIPDYFFYSLFLPCFNTNDHKILLNDKLITENFFRSYMIYQPITLGKLFNNHLTTMNMIDMTFEDLQNRIDIEKSNKLFIKPANGKGGDGIYIFNKNGKNHHYTCGHLVLTENFLHRIGEKNNYIIQAGINQHSDLSKIYPNSVNTFRICTENSGGRVKLLCATLRMGRGGMQVDNGSKDGILIKVDILNGKLSDYATSEQCEFFKTHPDTGFVFKNTEILNWEDIKNFVMNAAVKLPYFKYLGWDIALTQDGPIAIEANLDFGLDHFQIPYGGLRETFGIEDPSLYWKKKQGANIVC